MKLSSSLSLSLLAFVGIAIPLAASADAHLWPQFRGPDGNGIATAAAVPLRFSESENIAWKTPVPGKGWSSPVVTDNGKIWLTTAIEVMPTEEEREKMLLATGEDPKTFTARQIAKNIKLQVMELDMETGKLERTIDLITVEAPDAIHALNSYASPTPVLDGDRLICHFGTYGTLCLDLASGATVWKQSFPLEHGVGPGSSPFIDGDRLIIINDGVDQQYVMAVDKNTGETLWKTDRPEMRAEKGDQKKSYCTPIALTDKSGRHQLVCMGSQWLVSHDSATGEELWRLDHGSGFSVVPRPVHDAKNDLVFISTGFGKPELWAVRPDGKGDITDTDKVVWKEPKRIPAKPSPLLIGDELFVIQDGGVGSCFDAATGAIHWTDRIPGNYSASPLFANGHIYLCNQEGMVTVIAPGKTFQILAENQLDGQIMASPVALDGTLLIRSDSALYRVK